jgi:ATP adenylyltransferase
LERSFSGLLACFSSGREEDDGAEGPQQSYNMILTAAFMMLVPRRTEFCGPVAVNSMGFAGSMLVRSQQELDYIRTEGPMRILAAVGLPWND